MDEINSNITDKRIINVVYDFPYTFRHKCAYVQITQLDLIKIIRQIRSNDLKKQLCNLINGIDLFDTYTTNIYGQKIQRTKLLTKEDRRVSQYDEPKINK